MKQISVLALLALITLASCNKNNDHNSSTLTGTFTSSDVAMFGGKAKTWVSLTNGVPQQLAISINDSAMNSLPTDGDDEIETPVSLPSQASATVLDHVVIDWNPHGHPPIGVYSFPHFDFHFYTISKEEQMSIPAYEDDSTGFLKYPAPQYLPANYVPIPGGEAEMGTHWVDVTSPEMNGGAFTQTFVYGSYNGKVNFYEPMMTKAFLDTTTSFERSIPQPAAVSKSGYYPTKIKVSRHNGLTEIILDGFIQKEMK